MVQVSANGEYFGVFESAGSVVGARSKDRGANWNNRTVIDPRQQDGNMALTSTNAFSSDGSVQVWMIRGRF